MPERKHIISNIIVGLVVALMMLTISGVFGQNKKINDSVSHSELKAESIRTKKECNDHLNEVMKNHEKIHEQNNIQYIQIQSDLTIIKQILMEKNK